MKKTRVAILFLLLTLFAACLPAAAELPAQITKPCQNKDRIHNLIGYFALSNRHCGLYKCTHCGREGVYYSPYEEHSGGTETPTCTTGKTCALCGVEYGILGHDWARGRLTATAHTSAAARAATATRLILQAVPVAQQTAAPKRSVRCVVRNTAKKTQITMI